jgi:heat shock protein HslJ
MRHKHGGMTLVACLVLVACTRPSSVSVAPTATTTTPVTVGSGPTSTAAPPGSTTLVSSLSSLLDVHTRVVEALGTWTLESATSAEGKPVALDLEHPLRLVLGGVGVAHALIAGLGCNDLFAEGAAIMNGRLELKNPSITAVACDAQIVIDREHILDGLLEGHPTIEIADDQLTLRGMGTAVYRRT